MSEYEISKMAAKYDLLVNYLFNKSTLSWNNETIGIDSYEFSDILQIIEPEMYASKLENLKVREKEKKED